MPLFEKKKSRTARAATLRRAPTIRERVAGAVYDRGLMLRLIICLLAVIGLVIAVEGWKAPFPYRLDERAEHGLRAKIDFNRVNRFRTDQERALAEAAVPWTFRRDPNALDGLSIKMRAALTDVAQSDSVETLPEATRRAFGFTLSEMESNEDGMPKSRMDEDFAVMKAIVAPAGGVAGNTIDDLIANFEKWIVSPLREFGVADPAELARYEIGGGRRVRIVSPDESRAPVTTSLANIQIGELVADTGLVGKAIPSSEFNTMSKPLKRWLRSETPVTLRYDAVATEIARRTARESVGVRTDEYQKNQDLLEAGEPIDVEALAVLRAEYQEVESRVSFRQRVARVCTVAAMIAVLMAINGFYLVRYEPGLVRSSRRLGIFLLAIVITVALGRLMSYDPWRAEVIPVMAAVMLFAIAFNQVLAVVTAFSISLIVTLSTGGDMTQFIVLMSVTATAVIPLAQVSSRSALIKIGLLAGVVYFVVSLGAGAIRAQSFDEIDFGTAFVQNGLIGAGWCLVAGYLVAGSLPFIESTFGIVTDISLLEMSDVSHPLLQELVRRAPGTYNHSMTVATIGETAADAIGANGLLLRVGAYFHDVGKMLKPQYFIENVAEGGDSRHRDLAPAMSTLIIIGHVKDGVDLARQYDLPQPLIDFVEQHHGTTLVEYFYREAERRADQTPDHKSDVEESAFRYPGPKPQTREAGVMMLSDIVESASRTLDEPTPKRIENLVRTLAMKRLLDGQFDECSLTLSEIHTIQESLIKSLIGIYHGRIKYPEQQRTA